MPIRSSVFVATLTVVSFVGETVLAQPPLPPEVHLAPHLTQRLAAPVHLGDQVEVHGYHSAVPNFVVGTSVTNIRTGQTVVDQGPPPPPAPGC